MDITDTANELVVASGKSGKRGNLGVRRGRQQDIWNKIGSKMYCKTWGIRPIFYNNYKWKVIFKNCMRILKKNSHQSKDAQC